MPGVNYGRAVMKMRPDWQPGHTARPLDVVSYQNCLWVCLRETIEKPAAANASWMLATRSVESDVSGGVEGYVLTVVKVGADLKAQYKALPTYGISDITGLASALNGKSPTSHIHVAGDITGAALASRKINTTAPLSGGGDLTGDRTFKLNIGKGLKVDNNVLVLKVKQGSGLVMDDTGELYFDPSQMPTDQFEALLKSIRVPVWLSKSTTWYVDGTNGSDVNVDGVVYDGSSPDKAFKTIQKALNYVSENYNLGLYSAVISVAAGTYAGFRLPKYNASTGSITIQGVGPSTIVAGEVAGSGSLVQTVSGAGGWTIRDMQVSMTATGTGLVLPSAILIEASSSLTLVNVGVSLDVRNEITGVANNIKVASASGTLLLSDGVSLTSNSARTTGLYIVGAAQYNGVNTPMDISGIFGTVIDVTNGAKFTRSGNPPAVITGTATGKRYNVRALAVCDTIGGGPEYFPGSITGTVDSANFGVYK